jgi:hypothetical protein
VTRKVYKAVKKLRKAQDLHLTQLGDLVGQEEAERRYAAIREEVAARFAKEFFEMNGSAVRRKYERRVLKKLVIEIYRRRLVAG